MFNSLNDHFDKHCQTNTVRWVLISLLHGFTTHPATGNVLWLFPQFGFRTFQDETNLGTLISPIVQHLLLCPRDWISLSVYFHSLHCLLHITLVREQLHQMNILSTVHMLGSTAYHSRHERMPLLFYHFMLVQGFSIS